MKRTVILLLFLAGAWTVSAQSYSGFGILGGATSYNQFGEFEKGSVGSFQYGYRQGFIAGIYTERVRPFFVMDAGLYYVEKGHYNNEFTIWGNHFDGYDSYPIIEGESWTQLNYLEFSTHAGLRLGWLRVYAGPYVAMGLTGQDFDDYTSDEDGEIWTYESDDEIKFENTTYEDWEEGYTYRYPWDAGVDVGASIQMARWLILRVNYQVGMVNTRPEIEGSEYYVRNDGLIYNGGGRVSLIFLLSRNDKNTDN